MMAIAIINSSLRSRSVSQDATRSLLLHRGMTNAGTQQTLVKKMSKTPEYVPVEYPCIHTGVSQSLAEIFCCTQARKARVVAISPFFFASWINRGISFTDTDAKVGLVSTSEYCPPASV